VDVYTFRIAGVRGHVYVHTVLDDRSRYLVMARAYLRERAREATNNLWWVLRLKGVPRVLRQSGYTVDLRETVQPPRTWQAREVPRYPHPGARREGALPFPQSLPPRALPVAREVQPNSATRRDRLDHPTRGVQQPQAHE
jgi:hypothetical protein